MDQIQAQIALTLPMEDDNDETPTKYGNIGSGDEHSSNELSHTKEHLLHLTVGCEPSLVEEEDEPEGNGKSHSTGINLEDDCVDPLEFLEVNEGSAETKVESYSSDNGTVEIDVLDDSQDTDQESLHGKHLSSINTCEKCGCLKSIIDNTSDTEDEENTESKGNESKIFCACESEKLIKCKVCQKKFQQSSYASHLKNHKKSKKHICEICGKGFFYAVHLRSHAALHETDKIHFCDICSKSFKLFSTLKHHRAACKNRKKFYQCNDCDESFSLKRSLFSHMRTHEKVQEESFSCEICCIKFDSSRSKKDHIVEVHVEALRFVCDSCGEAFVTEIAMKRHAVSHTRSYPCKRCGDTFSKKRDLATHRLEHGIYKRLRCRACGIEYKHNAYAEHKLTECLKREKTYCELCNKSFKDKECLKKHRQIHVPESERTVYCEVCNKGYSSKSALRKHIRLIHVASRPYTCEFCSKSFGQLCKLKYHIVTHSSDRPAPCPVCGKGFSSPRDLKTHMRVHTGEKPYSCATCGKRFRQRGHVSSHQLVHTGERSHSCHFCNKSFGLTSSLKKHLKLHTTRISITSK